MPTVEERLVSIESIINDGLGVPELQSQNSFNNNDLLIFYSSTLNKAVRITYSDFLNLLGSGDITFVTELENDDITPTGNILIQQQGLTEVVIGAAAQSNQYSDLDGKPVFITQTDIDNLDFNLYSGNWDVSTNTPSLSDATGSKRLEYTVTGASANGTNYNFGDGEDYLLKNGDIIIYDGTNWIKKIDNNQSQEGLDLIPPTSNLPVKSYVLNDRMQKIFDSSGYRITNVNVAGVSNSSNVTTGTIYFYAVSTERYLLVDLNNLDANAQKIFSSKNKIYNISTVRTTNSTTNDLIGEVKNQATFTSNPISSLPSISSNFTIFPVNQTFRQFFSGEESMNVSIDLIADLNDIITQKIVLTDQDFTANSFIDLIPAPGVDKTFDIQSIIIKKDLTTPYENDIDFSFFIGNVFLGNTQGGLYTIDAVKGVVKVGISSYVGDEDFNEENPFNVPLRFRPNLSGINGVGTFEIHITYKII